MAQSSGPAGSGGFRESMEQVNFAQGHAEYEVSRGEDGSLYLTVRTPDGVAQRRFDYFIGSGHTGRSYLSNLDGFLFEAPASYYSSTSDWRISPGYHRGDDVQLLRSIEAACLNCHASRIRPVQGTLNRFATPAFLENGVSCERCHGPGESHIAAMRSGSARAGSAIVNPAKLDPVKRDSICQQCHLAGEVRIAKSENRQWHPGERFSDYVVTFVRADAAAAMQVNSHVERLALSKCARASGAKLWCGSCHDVHSTPGASERIAWYRQRCLNCHEQHPCSAPAATQAASADNCIGCHMPPTGVRDVQHTVYTDHSIPRLRHPAEPARSSPGEIAPFGGAPVSDREWGLAWATIALNYNDRASASRALPLLRSARATDPEDPKVAVQLAQIYDRMGRGDEACDLYERALANDAEATTAAINLGTCRANRGDLSAAISLWEKALARAPGEEAARLNLAVALYRTGERDAAVAALKEALRLDPLSSRARRLISEIQGTPAP
jgi:predicted CXXCH cytochrome family protein